VCENYILRKYFLTAYCSTVCKNRTENFFYILQKRVQIYLVVLHPGGSSACSSPGANIKKAGCSGPGFRPFWYATDWIVTSNLVNNSANIPLLFENEKEFCK
jgi:hypothetical protein